MSSWAAQAAQGKFTPGGAAEPKADDPGDGTLYDTAKFWGEEQRVEALKALGVLDTSREELFDKVTSLLMKIFDTQCSHLVLIDPNRCWFKSWQGRWCDFETDSSHGRNVECPREEGWCNYILVPNFEEILIIEDATKDARLALNPFVVGPPHFRFYAGAPLVGSRGERYGTLCVADFTPRKFSSDQYALLTNYAHLVVEELERDKPMVEVLEEASANYVERSRFLDKSLQAMQKGMCMVDMRDSRWPVMMSNSSFQKACGFEVGDRNFWDVFECKDQTSLELGIAMGLGDTFEMKVVCTSTGAELSLQLLPATSDRFAPSKCVAVPGWVPFEDGDGGDVNSRITQGRSKEIVRDCKCFWFVLVSDKPSLTAEILAKVEGEKGEGGGGYAGTVKRRPSQSSTGTTSQELASLTSSLNSSWKSFFGDYALPAKLNGMLELGPLLGSGSFGKAYRATERSQGTHVAVKVVDCRRRNDQAIREQLKEVQLGASLSHENIVRTLEYATSSGSTKGKQLDVLWIVQELCDLGNLVSATERGLLREERKITSPPDMKTVKSVLMDIARGMAYTHSMNIIHADLTGRNVLLQSMEAAPGFTAKVADFGLARYTLGGKCLPSSDIGTVTHMPPELMEPEGAKLNPKADVWAFGILAWEAYHGKACYQGKNPAQIVISIFRGQTPTWGEEAGDFGVYMKKCISYEFEMRPSFDEILIELASK